eukprot:7135055-Prymnesium_polylepis.1
MDGGWLTNGLTVTSRFRDEFNNFKRGVGAAFIFHNGSWAPICYEKFKDNHHGANTFCQRLGFPSGIAGVHKGFRTKMPPQLQLGACNAGEDLMNCTL